MPGLRLGVLASGDTELIRFLKKEIAIWNINSFAEFYMQIATKYEKDYKKALSKIKNERKRFYDELIKVCIKAISSFDEKKETPDSFIDKYLNKVNI